MLLFGGTLPCKIYGMGFVPFMGAIRIFVGDLFDGLDARFSGEFGPDGGAEGSVPADDFEGDHGMLLRST
jgi:hypothetical protein